MGYFGLTHWVPSLLLPLWRVLFCRVEWHALDEVFSSGGVEPDDPPNYLVCDACGLVVSIGRINQRWQQ